MAKKQTAGRDRLGKIAPKFAELNDDVLFGEVWSREDKLSPRDRSMVTIAALFSAGLYPQLKSHLAIGKEHGVTKTEVVEIVTQLAFYAVGLRRGAHSRSSKKSTARTKAHLRKISPYSR